MARPKKNPDFAELKCKTCNTDFRVKWQKRNKQKYCCKSCVNKDPEVLAKMRASQVETSLKKYGTDHPMKTSEVVNNFKNSMLTKYGVEHAESYPPATQRIIKMTLNFLSKVLPDGLIVIARPAGKGWA